MSSDRIDHAARTFVEAATTLADALLGKLQGDAPEIAAKAAQALQSGERMQLLLEFSLESPVIVWQTVDDYGTAKRLMVIPGRVPERH